MISFFVKTYLDLYVYPYFGVYCHFPCCGRSDKISKLQVKHSEKDSLFDSLFSQPMKFERVDDEPVSTNGISSNYAVTSTAVKSKKLCLSLPAIVKAEAAPAIVT